MIEDAGMEYLNIYDMYGEDDLDKTTTDGRCGFSCLPCEIPALSRAGAEANAGTPTWRRRTSGTR